MCYLLSDSTSLTAEIVKCALTWAAVWEIISLYLAGALQVGEIPAAAQISAVSRFPE